ncbi:MAG: CPBP family intramembrane metalloprotease [Clostridia bacterium]|nr:CPBP family intramembrane metalloprotease [Clostridia bacterium]
MSIQTKKVFMAMLLHFPIFVLLHTIPFIMGHAFINKDFLPFLSAEHLHFPLERWLIWVVPSLALILLFKNDLFLNLKEMFSNKVKWKTLVLCILPLLIYLVGGLILAKYTGFSTGRPLRKFASTHEFFTTLSTESWWALITPAIPEEMVFRAWIQNALLGKSPSRKRAIIAILISNIMFVIIHLPTYFYSHNLSISQIIFEASFVFIMGSVFGLMFLKSKNILVPIGAHWITDIFAFTFWV